MFYPENGLLKTAINSSYVLHFSSSRTIDRLSSTLPNNLYIPCRLEVLSFSTQRRQMNWTLLSSHSIGFCSVHTAQNVVSVCGVIGWGIATRLPKHVGATASLSRLRLPDLHPQGQALLLDDTKTQHFLFRLKVFLQKDKLSSRISCSQLCICRKDVLYFC